ncbi:CLUMA_CG006117, isoform A [Clunio marinus]|uniref:CLUMA_CG006117, isoform A n=1 Tax=Clunio marinus TaxID=568069 RepID=A0A1J1HX51_9DIPT|nr:CLUMA_CG006117, isoform A [Clunio marinus]
MFEHRRTVQLNFMVDNSKYLSLESNFSYQWFIQKTEIISNGVEVLNLQKFIDEKNKPETKGSKKGDEKNHQTNEKFLTLLSRHHQQHHEN